MKTVTREYVSLSGKIESIATPGPIVFACLDPIREMAELHIFTNLDSAASERAFKVYRTDDAVPPSAKYVRSVRTDHNGIVYHVFDVSEVPMKELDTK